MKTSKFITALKVSINRLFHAGLLLLMVSYSIPLRGDQMPYSTDQMIEDLLDLYEENEQEIEDIIDEVNDYIEAMNEAPSYGEEPYYTPGGDPDDYMTGMEIQEGLEEDIEEIIEEANQEIHDIENENEHIEEHLNALGYPVWC